MKKYYSSPPKVIFNNVNVSWLKYIYLSLIKFMWLLIHKSSLEWFKSKWVILCRMLVFFASFIQGICLDVTRNGG